MRVAEFFAGIGLVRSALEGCGFDVVWSNDIDPNKRAMYVANFDATHFRLGDIREISGQDVPDVDLATASFPCTDLSLAGNRLGLHGKQSGLFWEFARLLLEMRGRRPSVVMLENVPSFATSHQGLDLYMALRSLNGLGYWCDLLIVDARHFVPQSRPRLFIVGSQRQLNTTGTWEPSPIRPAWVERFVTEHTELKLHAMPLNLPPSTEHRLDDIVERLGNEDSRWWEAGRRERFCEELSLVQRDRLERMTRSLVPVWATAYRRTRNGKPAWEIRNDAISGCLRTARGGSSKQALVEAGGGSWRVRWMTAVEYARLQGADDFILDGIPENRALFGFGDAVCVPAVAWIASNYLAPLLSTGVGSDERKQEGLLALA